MTGMPSNEEPGRAEDAREVDRHGRAAAGVRVARVEKRQQGVERHWWAIQREIKAETNKGDD